MALSPQATVHMTLPPDGCGIWLAPAGRGRFAVSHKRQLLALVDTETGQPETVLVHPGTTPQLLAVQPRGRVAVRNWVDLPRRVAFGHVPYFAQTVRVGDVTELRDYRLLRPRHFC